MTVSKFLRKHWGTIATTALGPLILGLLKDIVLDILKGVFGTALSGLVYALLVLLALGLVIYLITRVFRPKPQDLVTRKPPKTRGLILLVGPGRGQESPEKTAASPSIEYHLRDADGKPVLRYCWLVASPQALGYTVTLQQEYQTKGVDMRVVQIKDAFDLHDTFEAVSRVYKDELAKEKLEEDQVIADFTGGTKPMSLGMALACTAQPHRLMQYMTGGRPDIESVPMLVKFEPQSETHS